MDLIDFFLILLVMMFIVSLFLIRPFITSLISFFPKQNFKQKYKSEYAIVTGATSGIGLLLSQHLSLQGFHVLMVGLPSKTSVQVHQSIILESDLALEETQNEISQFIKKYNPSLLFHCAGSCVPQSFHLIDSSLYIQQYITSMVKITQNFISQRKSGIVFISSQVSFWSNPFANLYASVKAFTFQFARSLSVEYPHIDVLCISPGPVNETCFFDKFPDFWFFRFIRFFGQKPESIVDLIFRALGRITLLDTGFYTHFTRAIDSLLDPNIVDFFSSIFVSPLRKILNKN